ncbi:MAG: transglycosylase SLT domain-containing protein [Myxococcota bacterium]
MRFPSTFTLAACLAVGAFAQPPESTDDPSAPPEGESESDPGFVRFDNPAFPAVRPVEAAEQGPSLSRADFAPYFASGVLAEAKAAFDAGRYSTARALLGDVPQSQPVRFLRGLAALRARDFAAAGTELEQLAADWPALKDRCLVHAGQAYEQLKDWEAAERVYAQVSAQSRLSVDAGLGRARALMRLKRSKEALELLSPWVDRPAPPWGRDVAAEALLVQADIYAWRGDEKKQRAALLALWSGHPMARREAARAEERLGDLSAVDSETLITRGEALIDAHRNAQGVALIEPLLPSLSIPDPTACRAHFAVGKGYRKLRKHSVAVQTLAPVVKRCKDPELKAKAQFTLGFSQTMTAPVLAAATYTSLAKGFPDHPLADDSLFFAADVHLRRGETEQAVERLIDVVDRYPQGDFAAEALFKLFWARWQQGRLDEAQLFLEELEGRYAQAEDGYEVERARYWRGRILEQLGRKPDAVELYALNALEHPATYYGLISRERVELLEPERGASLLSQVAAAPESTDPFPVHPGPLANDPRFLSAVELLRLGMGELVPGEILGIDRSALPRESVRLLVLVLSLSGQERQAHGLARLWLKRELAGPITPERRPMWEIAYPRAFRDIVVTHATAADGLDPDLLQALMREESALDPKALSWAGALGLCQLMPPTAAEVAAKLKLKRPSQAQLLEPDLNIRLGARYLSDLLLRAHGVKQFALAGYNAGESAVARWRRENGDEDLAAWVEQIPLQETRGYVKRVLRSYNTYKLLYAPADVARTVAPFQRAPALPRAGKG